MLNKKSGKKIRAVTKRGATAFKYLCECHNEPATKAPCEMPADSRIGMNIVVYRDGEKQGHAPKGESTLGSWRCATTSKPTKVSRVKNVAEKAITTQEVV